MRKNVQKQKEINITSREDCIVWQYDLADKEFDKVVKLNVGMGCQAAVYKNGGLDVKSPYSTGSYEIAWTKNTKKGERIEIICINRDKHFKLPFGAGQIPFNDREVSHVAEVGISGDCTYRVVHALKLYTNYGAGQSQLTIADISKELNGELNTILREKFSTVLSKYRYCEIDTKLGELQNTLKELYSEILLNKGIEVVGCTLQAPYWGDYSRTREELLNKKNKEASAPQSISDEKLLDEILKQNKEQSIHTQVTCKHCHCVNDENAKFCKVCGRKLTR